jgi:hypothetical protein
MVDAPEVQLLLQLTVLADQIARILLYDELHPLALVLAIRNPSEAVFSSAEALPALTMDWAVRLVVLLAPCRSPFSKRRFAAATNSILPRVLPLFYGRFQRNPTLVAVDLRHLNKSLQSLGTPQKQCCHSLFWTQEGKMMLKLIFTEAEMAATQNEVAVSHGVSRILAATEASAPPYSGRRTPSTSNIG